MGLYVPTVYLVVNRHFGVSSSLRDACAVIAPKTVEYFRYNWKEFSWRLFFVGGIAVGGFIGANYLTAPGTLAIAEHTKRILLSFGISDYSTLVPTNLFSFGSLLTLPGFVLIVVGGFLIGFGTRYADGCTSGHTIHGISNFHLSSVIASLCFYAGGILTTYVVLPFLLGRGGS